MKGETAAYSGVQAKISPGGGFIRITVYKGFRCGCVLTECTTRGRQEAQGWPMSEGNRFRMKLHGPQSKAQRSWGVSVRCLVRDQGLKGVEDKAAATQRHK